MPNLHTIEIAALLSVTGGQGKSQFTQKASMPSVPSWSGNGVNAKSSPSPTDFLCKVPAQGAKERECIPAASAGNPSAEASPWKIPAHWLQ